MIKHTYASPKPECEAIACDRACEFVHGLIANFTGEDLWFWLVDSKTLNGNRPSGVPIKIASGDSRSIDQEVLTRNYTNGLYVLASRYPYFKEVPAASQGANGTDVGCLFQFSVKV